MLDFFIGSDNSFSENITQLRMSKCYLKYDIFFLLLIIY